MTRPLRIAAVSVGRFHLCDLARELTWRGHDVRFYTLVPPSRAKKFELPESCHRWLLPRVAYRATAFRLLRGSVLRQWADRKLQEAFDAAVTRFLEPCDVLVGMSGLCNRAADRAKRAFGAKVWIERSSRHILSQKEILDRIPGAEKVPEHSVRRELRDYELADVISVLSQHCADSFRERGVSPRRIVRNTPGVSLDMFPPTLVPPPDRPTIVMVGTWCLRKGCDVLTAAWRQLTGVRLLHVGPIQDCPLPSDPLFEHVDTVPQYELSRFYARAHVFALASREEGLAYVQLQALASGLRLVCTDRTGGADLVNMIPDRGAVRVVPTDDANSLAAALAAALDEAKLDTGLRDRLGPAKDELTWAAYARRYEANLYERM